MTVDLSSLIGGGGIHWNPNAVTVSPKQLTFTPANRTTSQTVTVTGVVDGDSNHEHIIVVAIVSSTDTDYASPDRSEGVFVTVTDDGGAVQVGAYPATVREGATASVTVWLSRASTGTVTVRYATENGTATAGSDYTSANGSLTFAAGQTRKTVRIRTTDDTVEDSGETFRLALSNPTGASLAPHYTRAPVTIRNDEALLDGLSAEVAGSAGGPWTALGIGAFSSQTTAYAATVPQGTTHARLVPTTADEDLTLTAGKSGAALTRVRSGEAGPAVALAAGDNVLVVKASAAADVETTYAVTVNRGGTSTGGGGGGGGDPGGGDSGGGDSGGGDSAGDDGGDGDDGDGSGTGTTGPRPVVSSMSVEDTSLQFKRASDDRLYFGIHDGRADTVNDAVPESWNIWQVPLEFDAVKLYEDGQLYIDIDRSDGEGGAVQSALDPETRYAVTLEYTNRRGARVAYTAVFEEDIGDIRLYPDNTDAAVRFYDALAGRRGNTSYSEVTLTATVSDDPDIQPTAD